MQAAEDAKIACSLSQLAVMKDEHHAAASAAVYKAVTEV